MLVRFYNIIWEEDNDLPSSVTLEMDDDTDDNDIEMMGGEMLSDEFGEEVDSFEWEIVDEDEKEDPFSFGTDDEED